MSGELRPLAARAEPGLFYLPAVAALVNWSAVALAAPPHPHRDVIEMNREAAFCLCQSEHSLIRAINNADVSLQRQSSGEGAVWMETP